jgi:hypothetical protein
MHKLNNILILDDLKPVAELVKTLVQKEYTNNGIDIKYYSDIEPFKARLEVLGPQETLLMVNACFKTQGEANRYKFKGVKKIIKSDLRIRWFRLHPVIAYGVIPEQELLSSALGHIFTSNSSHKYLNIANIVETQIRPLIEEIFPVPNEEKLREIIHEDCKEELKKFIEFVAHDLKPRKLDYEEGRKKLLKCLEHLTRVLKRESMERLNIILRNNSMEGLDIDEIIDLLRNYNRRKNEGIKNVLEVLDKNLKEGCYAGI